MRGSRWIENHLPYILLVPAFLLAVTFTVAPSLYSVYISFTRYNINLYPVPVFDGLSQYVFAFTKDIFINQTFAITMEWVIVVIALNYSFGLALALLLNQRGLRGSTFFRVAFMISFAVPITGVWPIWERILAPSTGLLDQVLESLGLMDPNAPVQWINNYPLVSVAIIGLWSGFAFGAITILAALQGVPREEYEAAKIDAASRWNVFRYVEWPHLMPLNVILWMLGIVSALNTFGVIYVITGGGPGFATTTLYLYAYRSLGSGDYAYTSAIATMLFAIEMAVAVFYVKYALVRKT